MITFKERIEPPDLGFDKFRSPTVMVTEETHEKIKEISRRTGYQMKEVTEILLRDALERVKWEE